MVNSGFSHRHCEVSDILIPHFSGYDSPNSRLTAAQLQVLSEISKLEETEHGKPQDVSFAGQRG